VTDDAKLSFIATSEMIVSLTKIAGPRFHRTVKVSFEEKSKHKPVKSIIKLYAENCVYFLMKIKILSIKQISHMCVTSSDIKCCSFDSNFPLWAYISKVCRVDIS
jgi:hypothetical protein